MGLRGKAMIDIVDCSKMHRERNMATNLECAAVASFFWVDPRSQVLTRSLVLSSLNMHEANGRASI